MSNADTYTTRFIFYYICSYNKYVCIFYWANFYHFPEDQPVWCIWSHLNLVKDRNIYTVHWFCLYYAFNLIWTCIIGSHICAQSFYLYILKKFYFYLICVFFLVRSYDCLFIFRCCSHCLSRNSDSNATLCFCALCFCPLDNWL